MTTPRPVPSPPGDLERQRHYLGERLRGRDFADQLTAEERLRDWHNRAVHDAWGVVPGFAGELRAQKLPDGTTFVLPGLAYDPTGRPLLLQERRQLPAPGASESGWVLVLIGCEPRLEWQEAARWSPRQGVALFRLGPDGEPLAGWRPIRARPAARPRTAAGATPAGGTAWRLVDLDRQEAPGVFFPLGLAHASAVAPVRHRGLAVTIDTSAAGFTSRPCYFAWLQGGALQTSGNEPAVLAIDRLVDAAADRFTFELAPWWFHDGVRLVTDPATMAHLLDQASRRLYVSWLALRMPVPRISFLLA